MIFLKKHAFTILYSLLLVAFTVYVALDTFVIARAYTVLPSDDDEAVATASPDVPPPSPTPNVSLTPTPDAADETGEPETGWSQPQHLHAYSDGNIQIDITQYRAYDTMIYVADIRLSSPEYLKTAFAQNTYGRNITERTSEIAHENGAVLAINGDYYGAQNEGYVLRNGAIYRDSASRGQEYLVIWADGSCSTIEEGSVSVSTLLEQGAQQVLSFGPALVKDREVCVSRGEEVGRAKASNPRTAIGLIEELHYVFLVSDGRTHESEGLSLRELATFAQELGVTIAYNLDGGGSSTMYFNGEIINKPTTSGKSIKERGVSDIVYIG